MSDSPEGGGGGEQLPDGFFTALDMLKYRQLAESVPEGGRICELGVWKGRSLCSIAERIKRKNLQVVAIDTFQGTESEGDAHKEAKEIDLEQVFKDNLKKFGIEDHVTVIKATTHEAVQNRFDGEFDMVFIDADHQYDAVKQDIEEWLPKVSINGGILAGHDYCVGWSGVVKAVDEAFSKGSCDGKSLVWSVRKELND